MADSKKAPKISYEERINRHRKRIKWMRFSLCAVVAVIVVIIAFYVMTRTYSRAELSMTKNFVTSDDAAYLPLSDGKMVQYSKNGASCVDGGGNIAWNISYEMDQPIADAQGNVVAIADYGGRKIYVLNGSGQLCEINTNLPVHMLSASKSGEVAAVMDDSSRTWIRLYQKDGTELAYFIRSMEENGYPMAVAVSPAGDSVAVSNLKMEDTSVKSTISFYNFGSDGKKYEDHLVGEYSYGEEVFPYLRYINDNRCVAVSDSRMAVFDTSKVEPQDGQYNMLTETIQGVFGSDRYTAMLFPDVMGEEQYRLDLYSADGTKAGEVHFTMIFTHLQIVGDKIYINNDQSAQIYTIKGKQLFSGSFDKAVKILIPSQSLSRLAAITGNEIDAVKLR